MNDIVVKKKSFLKVLLLDVLVFLSIYLLPVISHNVGIPLYIFDPMRIAVLGSLLILNDKRHSLLLAFTLPLFSYYFCGHPIFYKNIIIAIELCLNLLFLNYFLSKKYNTFLSVLGSIIISKVFYYSAKFLLLFIGVLDVQLIDTSIAVQMLVSIIISYFLSKHIKK